MMNRYGRKEARVTQSESAYLKKPNHVVIPSWTRRWHNRETPPRSKKLQSGPESDNPSAFLQDAAPNLHESACFHPPSVQSSSAETLAELGDSCKARERRLVHFKVEEGSVSPTCPIRPAIAPGPRGAAPSPPSRLGSLPNSLRSPSSPFLCLSLSVLLVPTSPALHCASMTNRAKRKLHQGRRGGGGGGSRVGGGAVVGEPSLQK